MAFGRGKKRESWSSRPLSMILPDNVKLFQRKSKTVLEKALQDQHRKGIQFEPEKPLGDSISYHEHSAKARAKEPSRYEPIHEEQHIESDTDRSGAAAEQSSRDNKASKAKELVAESTPFLTLNLGDTPNSLLDISDQYSTEDATTALPPVESPDITLAGSSSPAISNMTNEITDLEGETSAELSQSEADKTFDDDDLRSPAESRDNEYALVGNEAKAKPNEENEDANVIDITQMPWLVPARDTSLMNNATDEFSELANELASLQLSKASIRQDSSTSSTDTASTNATTADEFVLASNRKIMVNRGVYIFDPANDTADILQMKLSADESFNPFEYE